MGKDQRTVVNYLKTAGLSKGYYLYVFAGGVAFLGILMFYASRLLSEVNIVLANMPDAGLSAALQDRIYTVAILFFICFMAFLTITVFYMIVLGQRVGGPIIAICAYINELKKGNYDAKRSLRKKDELTPIMLELEDLAATLRAKTANK
jgi:signal transduction histidine kinase